MIKKSLFCLLISILSVFILTTCYLGKGQSEDVAHPVLTPRNAPAFISAVNLEISADDMETITVTDIDPSETSVTIEVPAGEARTFNLTIDTGSAVFEGSATENLVAGESVDIGIDMEMTDMRIIIPDASYYVDFQYLFPWYGRLVQIDDMTGAGWIAKDGTDFGYATDSLFHPYDVDFDEFGRIYIVNRNQNDGGSDSERSGSIIRIDSILDSTPETLVTGSNPTAIELGFITIDRKNSKMYYCLYNSGAFDYELIRTDYDGGNIEVIATHGSYPFYDAEVGTDGIYVLWEPEGLYIDKLDFDGSYLSGMSGGTLNNDTFDLYFSDPFLYVANWEYLGTTNNILQYDSDLNYIKALDQNPAGTEQFIGPHRMLATLRRKFYLLDEEEYDYSSGNPLEKLYAFDDIDGTNWESFSPADIGEDLFHFYHPC